MYFGVNTEEGFPAARILVEDVGENVQTGMQASTPPRGVAEEIHKIAVAIHYEM